MNKLIELNKTFVANSKYLSRNISMGAYLALLKEHNVEFQGSDSGTRNELAKVLAKKNISLQ